MEFNTSKLMMHKIWSGVCIFFFCLASIQAQSQRHDVIVGGSMRLDYKSVQEFNILTIELVPYAGYFITKGLQVGMGLGVGAEISTNGLHGNYINLLLNPQLRYYFYPAKRVGIFPYVGYVYKDDLSIYNNHSNLSIEYMGVNAGIGVPFYITDKLILEPTIGYRLESRLEQDYYKPLNYHYLEFRLGLVYTVFRKK